MRSIETSIDIKAPLERVWAILSDTAAYPGWNQVILRLDGEWKLGGRLLLVIQPPGHRATTFRPLIQDFRPGQLIRWRGRLPDVPGLFQGIHEFRLEPLPEGRTRFHHVERFSGILVPLLGGTLRDTERGYLAMNEALKARAEAGPVTAGDTSAAKH